MVANGIQSYTRERSHLHLYTHVQLCVASQPCDYVDPSQQGRTTLQLTIPDPVFSLRFELIVIFLHQRNNNSNSRISQGRPEDGLVCVVGFCAACNYVL